MKQYAQCNFYLRLSHTFDERIPLLLSFVKTRSLPEVREAMLNVSFPLLSQQQTRISCDRYMVVVKETKMNVCKMSKITTIPKYRLPIKNEIIPLV